MLLNIAGGFQMVCCTYVRICLHTADIAFLNNTNNFSRRPPCAIVENVRVRDINGA